MKHIAFIAFSIGEDGEMYVELEVVNDDNAVLTAVANNALAWARAEVEKALKRGGEG